jgi:hypothetical protein
MNVLKYCGAPPFTVAAHNMNVIKSCGTQLFTTATHEMNVIESRVPHYYCHCSLYECD